MRVKRIPPSRVTEGDQENIGTSPGEKFCAHSTGPVGRLACPACHCPLTPGGFDHRAECAVLADIDAQDDADEWTFDTYPHLDSFTRLLSWGEIVELTTLYPGSTFDEQVTIFRTGVAA